MATETKIQIRASDRVAIVGATGTGKSTVAACLLARRKFTVILDPKRDFKFPKSINPRYGTAFTTSIPTDVISYDLPGPVIYQPESREVKSGLGWFWDWVWWRENMTVYIDELFLVKKNTQELFYGHERSIMQGRSKNISVWSSFQRPARVPIIPLSESEHVFTFRLRHPADIRRMAEYTDKEIENDPVTGHDFWYYGDRSQILVKSNARNLSIL
jgi:uncharacterized protein DUF87